jgi:hypothetical protein
MSAFRDMAARLREYAADLEHNITAMQAVYDVFKDSPELSGTKEWKNLVATLANLKVELRKVEERIAKWEKEHDSQAA